MALLSRKSLRAREVKRAARPPSYKAGPGPVHACSFAGSRCSSSSSTAAAAAGPNCKVGETSSSTTARGCASSHQHKYRPETRRARLQRRFHPSSRPTSEIIALTLSRRPGKLAGHEPLTQASSYRLTEQNLEQALKEVAPPAPPTGGWPFQRVVDAIEAEPEAARELRAQLEVSRNRALKPWRLDLSAWAARPEAAGSTDPAPAPRPRRRVSLRVGRGDRRLQADRRRPAPRRLRPSVPREGRAERLVRD